MLFYVFQIPLIITKLFPVRMCGSMRVVGVAVSPSHCTVTSPSLARACGWLTGRSAVGCAVSVYHLPSFGNNSSLGIFVWCPLASYPVKCWVAFSNVFLRVVYLDSTRPLCWCSIPNQVSRKLQAVFTLKLFNYLYQHCIFNCWFLKILTGMLQCLLCLFFSVFGYCAKGCF